MKKLLFLIIALMLCATSILVSCGEAEPNPGDPTVNDPENPGDSETDGDTVIPTAISLSKITLSMYAGDSFALGVSVYPTNASLDAITWKSSNPDIAECSGGVITAKSVGTTMITASTSKSRTATCTVTVSEKPLSEADLKSLVQINLPEFPIRINYTDPETNKSAIAEISSAVVRMREDKSQLTGEDVARVFVKFNVTKVYDQDGIDGLNPIYFALDLKPDSGVSSMYEFEKRGEDAIKIGERFSLVNPSNAANLSLSSDEIGIVFDARNYKDGRTFDIEIKGYDDDDVITGTENLPGDTEDDIPDVDSTKLTISNKNLYLAVGGAFALVANVVDANGEIIPDAEIIWESTDENVVTCKDGLVTAHKEGMAAVYAKVDSMVEVCMVSVIDPARMVTFDLPEMPIELDCIDPLTGKKTSLIIHGCSFEHLLDYREGDGNFVRVTMKFDVEKVYDEEGSDGINMVAFSINLYEAGFAGKLESTNRGETKIKVGEKCTVEYVFGARFHEGRRNFRVEILPLTAEE